MGSSRHNRKKRKANCKHCGKEFISNKVTNYNWTEHCKECVAKRVWINRS